MTIAMKKGFYFPKECRCCGEMFLKEKKTQKNCNACKKKNLSRNQNKHQETEVISESFILEQSEVIIDASSSSSIQSNARTTGC